MAAVEGFMQDERDLGRPAARFLDVIDIVQADGEDPGRLDRAEQPGRVQRIDGTRPLDAGIRRAGQAVQPVGLDDGPADLAFVEIAGNMHDRSFLTDRQSPASRPMPAASASPSWTMTAKCTVKSCPGSSRSAERNGPTVMTPQSATNHEGAQVAGQLGDHRHPGPLSAADGTGEIDPAGTLAADRSAARTAPIVLHPAAIRDHQPVGDPHVEEGMARGPRRIAARRR
ncbi:MAG: hypothetical protein R3D25_04030 [Geminicoccaceae bacterium]